MKTMIKIFTLILIVTLASNIDTYANSSSSLTSSTYEFGPGNRLKVKVQNKKRKMSRESSYYSLKFNTRNINKVPKLGRKKRGFLSFL